MTYQQTSLLAFASIKDKLSSRQSDVLEVIEQFGPLNNRQIAEKLHLPINSVTPRCLELREKQRVELAFTKKDTVTGRSAIYWRAMA